MNSSEKIEILSAALVQFQSHVESVSKTQEAQAGTRVYRYADLAAVMETIRPALAQAGLAVTQTFVPCKTQHTDGRIQHLSYLRTTVLHQSGQWIASEIPVVAAWSDPQRLGSAITYIRRYALLAILSLACEDDDGAAARGAVDRGRMAGSGDPRRTSVGGRTAGPGDPRQTSVGEPLVLNGLPKVAAPADGKELYRKARARDTKLGSNETMRFLRDLGANRRWPQRLIEWSPSQAAEGWQIAAEHFRAAGTDSRPPKGTNGATERNGVNGHV